MSGSGKSTLADCAKKFYKKKQYKVCIVDGDNVRDKDTEKLGFDYKDVLINNIRISKLCLKLKEQGFNLVLVPVISPYNEIRKEIRSILGSNLHLIYIKTNINVLRERDTKGLYTDSDKGLINDLIGYSDTNPYEVPADMQLTIDTGNGSVVDKSCEQLCQYINQIGK
jgi:adenylylsulfate kinase-like enzyme